MNFSQGVAAVPLTFSEIVAQQPHNKGYSAAPVFTEGEKVYAFHQNMLYEAKILKVEMRNKLNSTRLGEQELHYFIHYQGWKPKWDEWVNDSRILKYSDQNREFQRQMRDMKEGNRKKRSLRKLRELTPPPTPKKSRTADETNEEVIDAPESLELPFVLQKLLAEDYDAINNHKQVVSMPVQISVAEILSKFADEKLQKSNSSPINIQIILDIGEYFDRSIGTSLLYRFERPQYQRVIGNMKDKKCPDKFSLIYGPQHLLRLFYLLPGIIEEASLPDDSRNLILFHVAEILEYMERNSPELFTSKAYVAVSDDYYKDL